jgi:hypothetical protein
MNQDEVSVLVQGQLQQCMQQILSDVKSHVTGLLQAQAQTATAPCPQVAATPRPAKEDSEDETDEDPWDGVLPTLRRTPLGAGLVLAQRLSCPPRLDGIKDQMKQMHFVQGIPLTIPPRRHRTDRALYMAQSKLEGAMSLMVDVAEAAAVTSGPLLAAAALVRSSFEDMTDLRRRTLAGYQSNKLDPREDSSQLRLLSPEEERRIKPVGKGKGKGKGGSSYGQSYDQSFRSNWKPKGKGKGGKGGRGRNSGSTSMQE